MIAMVQRQRAAQAVVDRFLGRPLAYGSDDCARMAALALRQMGHRPQLGKAGAYRTELGAVRALKRFGHASLADAIDSLGLQRIAPAATLIGDLVMLPAEGAFGGALAVVVGNGRVLGWHEAVATAEILQPIVVTTGWRL